MEKRQEAERFDSDVIVTSGSWVDSLSTSSCTDPGPSHSDSVYDSTLTATPPALSSSWPSAETSLLASLAGVSESPSSLSDAASAFFANKGAIAGVFTGLGILILSLIGILYVGWTRRRQKYSKKRKSNSSMTFSAVMRRIDANPTSRDPEPPTKVSIHVQRTVNQSVPHRISMSSLSEWWIRRRERRSSQFRQIIDGSRPPSVIDNDIKRPEEETQWTLGKVLEDQRKQVVTPASPASLLPITQPNSARRMTRGPGSKASRSSRGGLSLGESEGADFTLEDALLSLSSLHNPYELGSNRSGRHPYARA